MEFFVAMNPAKRIIDLFGSAQALAESLGIDATTVWRWTRPRPRGTGGYIPRWHHPAILKAAKRQGLRVTAAMLVASERA